MTPILHVFCGLILSATIVKAQVMITEIQPAPSGEEPEWVEIENVGTKASTITGWQICDDRSCAEIPATRLLAGQRAILTRDVAGVRAASPLPPDARVIEVALPTLNNTTDAVVLRDEQLQRVDSLAYDLARHPVPRSLERQGEATETAVLYQDRWTPSVDRSGATPGRLNSVVIVASDVGIESVKGADDAVLVRVSNRGRQRMVDVPVIVQLPQRRLVRTVPVVETGQSQEVSIPLTDLGWPLLQGIHQAQVVAGAGDSRPENDSADAVLHLPPRPGTVMLNEILFDPLPGIDDYVELANTSADTVDLGGWILQDEGGSSGQFPTGSILKPQGFLVAANSSTVADIMDSGVPSVLSSAVNFNSTGDRVMLRTPSGFLVDAATYSSAWHSEHSDAVKGRALEKRSPALVSDHASSWTTSTDPRGGTPGGPNTVARRAPDTGTLGVSPSPFSSDERSLRHPAMITFEQPFTQAVARMTVYTPEGALVADLLESAYVGSRGGAVWNGRGATGERVSPGPYVVVLECVDAASSAVHHATAVIVVGD